MTGRHYDRGVMKKAQFRYDKDKLEFYRRRNGKEECIGAINTNRGGLTREQKLLVIRADGEWISF